MTFFQDKLLTRTDCDEAGDYVVPNVLIPRNLVFRPDIGHKLYHHHLPRIFKSFPRQPEIWCDAILGGGVGAVKLV